MMQLSEKTGIKQNVLQEIIRLAKENDVKKLILLVRVPGEIIKNEVI